MLRKILRGFVIAILATSAHFAHADGIDELEGHFAFNWLVEPDSTRCAAVDGERIALFQSDAYTCDLTVRTNTASGEPARVCTEKSGGAEYLIFATEAACEDEREAQAANSEE